MKLSTRFGLVLIFGIVLVFVSKIALHNVLPSSSAHYQEKDGRRSRYGSNDPKDAPQEPATESSALGKETTAVTGHTEIYPTSRDNVISSKLSRVKELNRNCPTPRTCKVSFPPTCSLYNRLIKYWDEDADCFTSPLRKSSGLQNSVIEERRYVVMQPDLGGWNNIRMALEFGILFALVTGRIFVLPPPAVFYLLHRNKKWKDNFSTYSDYLDFERLVAHDGLEVITMKEFLETVASRNLLSKPLPENNTDLVKQPLWDYLESASYVRQWSPGKIFLGFNITSTWRNGAEIPVFGNFNGVSKDRWKRMTIDKVDRQMVPYDEAFHSHRVVYFPGTAVSIKCSYLRNTATL
jgi:hypothetical protein